MKGKVVLITTVLGSTIALLFFTNSHLASAQAAEAGHYYQLRVIPPALKPGKNIIKTVPVLSTMFWRTRANSNGVEVYEICKDPKRLDESLGIATGTVDKGWRLKGGEDDLIADIVVDAKDKSERMELRKKDGTVWAEGFRINPTTCDKESGLPVRIERYSGPESIVKYTAEELKTKLKSVQFRFELVRDQLLSVLRPVTPTEGKEATSAKVETGMLYCKTAPMTEKAVRDLTNSPALVINPQLWAGNLIQGGSRLGLANGKMTPIVGMGRSGGKITIEGVTFKSEDGKEPVYSMDLDVMSKANYEEARAKLLSQPVQSTEALTSFNATQVYSNEQMAFALGVDGRYASVQFSAALKIDTSAKKNYVLARFTQIFYTVSYEDPELTYDVFKGGPFEGDEEKIAKLKDIDQLIGYGVINKDGSLNPDDTNPPLYVKSVSYGRTIYFLASSEESAMKVSAALEGAYGAKDAGSYISVNSQMSYEKAMKNTEIAYFAFGGSAKESTGVIDAKTPGEMFNKVKALMASETTSEVGANTRGSPIAYSINFLATREPASIGYATSYDKTECEIVPTGYFSYEIGMKCIDDSVTVTVADLSAKGLKDEMQFGKPITVDLDVFMKPEDKFYEVTVQEYNIAGPWCSDFHVKRQRTSDKTYRPDLPANTNVVEYFNPEKNLFSGDYYLFKNGGGALVGNQSTIVFRANRATGKVQVMRR